MMVVLKPMQEMIYLQSGSTDEHINVLQGLEPGNDVVSLSALHFLQLRQGEGTEISRWGRGWGKHSCKTTFTKLIIIKRTNSGIFEF